MGQKIGYFLCRPTVVHGVGLIAIALFPCHAISSLVFSVLDLAPSSPYWGLALALGGSLAMAGAAAGVQSLMPHHPRTQRLTGLVSGLLSGAILGFYTLGQLTGQQAQWAVVGAVVGGIAGGRVGLARRNRFGPAAIALTSGLCAYGTAFGCGTWAMAAAAVQRWDLALGLGLITGIYLWFTRRVLGMAWRYWRHGVV